MIKEFLYFLLLVQIMTCVAYLLGRIILQQKPFSNNGSFFIPIYIGIISFVFISSIYLTNGQTINWALLLPGILVVLYYRKNNATSSGTEYKKAIELYSLFNLLYIISAIILFIFPYAWSIDNDIVFYSKISENLTSNGYENTFHFYNNYENTLHFKTPYHYFELWLNGIIDLFVGNQSSNLVLLRLLTYPFMMALFLTGIYELFILPHFSSMKKRLVFIFIFILLILTNYNWIFNAFNNPWAIYYSIIDRANFIIYYLALLPALFFLYQKDLKMAVSFLLFLPIFSITTAPAIFTGTVLFILLLWVFKKISFESTFRLILPVLITALFIFAFYRFLGSDLSYFYGKSITVTDLLNESLQLWKSILFMVITLHVRLLIFFIIVGLITYIIAKRYLKPLWGKYDLMFYLIFFITSSGIIIFQIAPTLYDTYQFPYIGYCAVILVLMLLMMEVIRMLDLNRTKFIMTSCIIILLFFISNFSKLNINAKGNSFAETFMMRKDYSVEQIATIQQLLDKTDNTKGGFVICHDETVDSKRKTSLTYQFGEDIYYLKSRIELFPLTPPDVLYADRQDSAKYDKAKSFNSILRYYKNFKEDPNSYMNDFIIKNKLEFIVSDDSCYNYPIKLILLE